MEAYFKVVARNKSTDAKGKQSTIRRSPSSREETTDSIVAETSGSSSAHRASSRNVHSDVSAQLLKTLSDPTNPITHSDIGDRTQHYTTFAGGHQVAEERIDHTKYMVMREAKLKTQRDDLKQSVRSTKQVLEGVKVYINGYLESTTDIEMKRIVTEGGGRVLGFPSSQCTHIVTSRCLSGSKTHKLLTKKGSGVKVVTPEWVFDSIVKGKRQPERMYSILRSHNSLD